MVGGKRVTLVRLCPGLSSMQGRLFTYDDTHRHRLGPNFHQIPVNCPYATRARNYQRDGFMTIDGNQGPGGWGHQHSKLSHISNVTRQLSIFALLQPCAKSLPPLFPQEELLITFLTVSVALWTTHMPPFPRHWWLVGVLAVCISLL